jgi:hypothetical protein
MWRACLGFWLLSGGGELAPPFPVEAGGRAIDVEGGNSAPFWQDLDGDGLAELLVGQFEQGCVRVYKNLGAKGAPRFDGFEFLRAGDGLLRVPYG